MFKLKDIKTVTLDRLGEQLLFTVLFNNGKVEMFIKNV